MTYQLPDLPYDYGDLEPHYSGKIIELHHDKHHAAYVKGANEALEKLVAARDKKDFSSINELEKNLAFNVSGHVLHSLLWQNLTPDGGGEPEREVSGLIDEHFGSFQGFKGQLEHAANGVQGSGWAALAWEPMAGRLIVEQIYDHQGNVGQGSVPLLVCDMWEHAYYLQFHNEKADWVKAFWKLVNWDDVAQRLKKVRRLELGLDHPVTA